MEERERSVSLDRGIKPTAIVFRDLPVPFPDPYRLVPESSHRRPVTTNMQTTKSGRRDLRRFPQRLITEIK
ncbi:hypothetical protein TNCV_1066091 [Trichonephila clavipes]|nr:hypothetical protein TNCV_1066091 [Trichonephila clavipes]